MGTVNIEADIERLLTNKGRCRVCLIKKVQRGQCPHNILTKNQLETLRRYIEFYRNKRSTKGGIIKLGSAWNTARCLHGLGVYLKKSYEEATKEEIVSFFTQHLKKKSEATKSNCKVVVRSFYKWMYGMRKKHEFPDVVDDERLEPTKAKPRKVTPTDLFTKEEVLRMIQACYSPLDKCIVSMWYEIGLRAKEYVSANVGSIEFVSGGAKLFVEESKTETGYVPLVMSAPYLQEWLAAHPFKNDPKAPLFVGMRAFSGKRLGTNAINEKLKRIAERAGITKRVFTHLGRNISITRLDGQMSIEDNARIHGITAATVLGVYTRRTRKEACEKYFDLNGRKKTSEELIEEEEEKKKLLPKRCISCDAINGYDRHYCIKCLRPIDLQTFNELENKKQKQLDDLREELIKKALDVIDEKLRAQ